MNKDRRIVQAGLLSALLIWFVPASGWAAFWDGSTDSGYQNTDGTWGSDNYWTTDGVVLGPWVSGATAVFAGDADGDFTVTVSGTQTNYSIRQYGGFGNYTLNDGVLETGWVGLLSDSGTLTVNSVLAGDQPEGTFRLEANNSTLVIGGNNTFTGIPTIRGGNGAVKLTNVGALGQNSTVYFEESSVTLDLNGLDISGKDVTIKSGVTGFIRIDKYRVDNITFRFIRYRVIIPARCQLIYRITIVFINNSAIFISNYINNITSFIYDFKRYRAV